MARIVGFVVVLTALSAGSLARAGIDSTTSTLATTSTLIPSTTSTTLAAQLLTGKKLLLKPNALNALSKDTSLTLGDGQDSADDPTLHGGSLRIYSATAGVDATFDIPAEQWEYVLKKAPTSGGGGGYYPYAVPVGTLLGYRIHKTGPVTSLQVKGGKKLKIVARGDELGMALAADPSPVLLELRLGAERYCLEFGGSTTFSVSKKLQAKNAPAAAACPP
jgi:hypothetical protein